MDIPIGKIEITKNRVSRTPLLLTSNIRGLYFRDGVAYAVVINDLSEKEKTDLLAAIGGLSDGPLPEDIDKTDWNENPFKGKTMEEVEQYVEDNAKDLAGIKEVLKNIALAVAFISRRL